MEKAEILEKLEKDGQEYQQALTVFSEQYKELVNRLCPKEQVRVEGGPDFVFKILTSLTKRIERLYGDILNTDSMPYRVRSLREVTQEIESFLGFFKPLKPLEENSQTKVQEEVQEDPPIDPVA